MNRCNLPTNIKVEKEDTATTSNQTGHTNTAAAVNHQEVAPQVPANNGRDVSTDFTEMNHSQQLVLVGEVSYRETSIKIFTDRAGESRNNSHPRFFFEPIVVLDPNSITIQSQELFQEDVVHFAIQMWTPEIRSKVLDRLRLKKFKVDEDDVTVMPYNEVQLVNKPGSIHPSIKIMEEAIPYHRLNEQLEFFMLCDSPATAQTLADNLRLYPAFVVRKWQLALECRGLGFNSSNTGDKRSSFKFMVSAYPASGREQIVKSPSVTDYENQIKDLQAQIVALTRTKVTAAVPVFSVVECMNPFAPLDEPLAFSSFDFATKNEYGDFDLTTGTFTINKAGMFQFTFTGLVYVSNISPTHQFELMVDGNSESIAFLNLAGLEAMQPVVISAFLQLKVGQKVSIIRVSGGLFQVPKTRCTCFSSSFFT